MLTFLHPMGTIEIILLSLLGSSIRGYRKWIWVIGCIIVGFFSTIYVEYTTKPEITIIDFLETWIALTLSLILLCVFYLFLISMKRKVLDRIITPPETVVSLEDGKIVERRKKLFYEKRWFHITVLLFIIFLFYSYLIDFIFDLGLFIH